LEDAGAVTARIERLRDVVARLAEGLPTDPAAVARDLDLSLDVVERLARSGRGQEAIRLARVLSAALLLLGRWVALLEALELTLAAARAVGDRAAEAWALSERGTLAAAVGDPSAQDLLRRALNLRRAIGERSGAELTAGNLQAAGLSAGNPLPAALVAAKHAIAGHTAAAAAAGAVAASAIGAGFVVADGWYGIGADRAASFGPPGKVRVDPPDAPPYVFTAAGEFVLAESTEDDFEVQWRVQRASDSQRADVTAVAASVAGSRVVVDLARKRPLRVDGGVARGDDVTLPEAAELHQSEGFYEIVWPDESSLEVTVEESGRSLKVSLGVASDRQGHVGGLFGNYDGDPANDFVTSDGRRLEDPAKDGYREFTESWRVPEDDSLFD
jgi:hypothetical protein